MAKMENVQAGVAKFIDRDIAPSLSGWDRVIIAAGGGILASRLPDILAQYAEKPIFAAMRIYDPESGDVDIDALYQAAKPYMGTEPLPLKTPALNVTIKMGKKEIDTLYAYIKEEL